MNRKLVAGAFWPLDGAHQRVWQGLGLACVLGLAGCSASPPVPDWSLQASDAAQRAMDAQLEGAVRVAELEWGKARSEAAKTGQPSVMARLALMRCAVQLASLDLEACTAYAAYAQDAAPPEQAYHRYLYGGLRADDVALLPPQHQAIAAVVVQGGTVLSSQLQTLKDPRARLVAAGAALRAGSITLAQAWPVVDSAATAQGWRRPLMTWMELERRRLQQAGDGVAAQALQRRLDILRGSTR